MPLDMDILRSKLLLPSMIKWKILGKFMNDKVWIRSLALGFLFVLSSVVTSYMVFILKKYFNAMNHPMGGLWNAPVHANYYRLSR